MKALGKSLLTLCCHGGDMLACQKVMNAGVDVNHAGEICRGLAPNQRWI
jgi:hypothetical protein